MKKILTIMLDGFGVSEEDTGNSVKIAEMSHYNSLIEKYPHTYLYATGEQLGLKEDEIGNCAFNNMVIGAGRVLPTNNKKVTKFLKDEYSENNYFKDLLTQNEKRVHLIGLCSDGKVYSNINHTHSLYKLLLENGFKEIYFHVITDGRDVDTTSSSKYIASLENLISSSGIGSISTICGRKYAMDKNDNFDRTEVYYNLITKGKGTTILKYEPALKSAYEKGYTDEDMPPLVLNTKGLIQDDDIIIWTNFRNDRSKQILSALSDSKFSEFNVKEYSNIRLYTFIPIENLPKVRGFIPKETIDMPLGIYLSKLGLKQARIAETEKYSMATYYLDGGFSNKLDGCDKFKISSPNEDEYIKKPEMSSVAITKKAIECMDQDYDFIFANYANLDTLGHTGNFEATTRGCIAIDLCLGELVEAAEENFYTIVLISDHGNVERMLNEDGTINKFHTNSKVPFLITDNKVSFKDNMNISNIAPTILDYMDISIPEAMTSDSILEK